MIKVQARLFFLQQLKAENKILILFELFCIDFLIFESTSYGYSRLGLLIIRASKKYIYCIFPNRTFCIFPSTWFVSHCFPLTCGRCCSSMTDVRVDIQAWQQKSAFKVFVERRHKYKLFFFFQNN